MWEAEHAPADDPLRQGDLLKSVLFPILKVPLETVALEGKSAALVATKYKWGLVVSQCCDNENDDYAAIAQVQPRTNLTAEQNAAYLAYEPVVDDPEGYIIEEFRLEPYGDLQPPNGGQQVALLNRVSVFWGDCSPLRATRIARMKPEGRRWLRLNLSMLWGRAEADDRQHLQQAGVPAGFLPPPDVWADVRSEAQATRAQRVEAEAGGHSSGELTG